MRKSKPVQSEYIPEGINALWTVMDLSSLRGVNRLTAYDAGCALKPSPSTMHFRWWNCWGTWPPSQHPYPFLQAVHLHALFFGKSIYANTQADVPERGLSGAICVQGFDDSLNSAIHTTYRISLRSSSLCEPRYPLLKVVFPLLCLCFQCRRRRSSGTLNQQKTVPIVFNNKVVQLCIVNFVRLLTSSPLPKVRSTVKDFNKTTCLANADS